MAVALLAIGWAAPARAQSGTSAAATGGGAAGKEDELVDKALELRRQGDDQAAHPLFVQAYQLARSPRAAAQLGFCEQALGRWADAEAHLTESLKGSSEPWIRRNKAAILDSLAKAKKYVASVEVVGEPAGGEVSIDGVAVGKLPLPSPVRVSAGSVIVELKMSGYRTASRSLQLVGGQYQKVLLRAERLADNAPGGGTAVAINSDADAGTGDDAQTTGLQTSARPADPESSGDRESLAASLRVGAWVTAGVGIAALGVGVAETLIAANKQDDFNKAVATDAPSRTCGTDLSNYGGVMCAGLYDDWKQARTISLVGFIGAGVLAATSVTLFVLSAPRADGAQSSSFLCAPQLRGVGAACAVRF